MKKNWKTSTIGWISIGYYVYTLIVAPYAWNINLPILFVGLLALQAKDHDVTGGKRTQ